MKPRTLPANRPCEEALVRALRHVMAAAEEVRDVHDEAAGKPCDCAICDDCRGALWMLQNVESCISGCLHALPEDIEKWRHEYPEWFTAADPDHVLSVCQ